CRIPHRAPRSVLATRLRYFQASTEVLSMKRLSRLSLLVVAGVVAILAVAGCSRSLLTSPELETSATSTSAPATEQATAPAPPAGRLAGPSLIGIELPP